MACSSPFSFWPSSSRSSQTALQVGQIGKYGGGIRSVFAAQTLDQLQSVFHFFQGPGIEHQAGQVLAQGKPIPAAVSPSPSIPGPVVPGRDRVWAACRRPSTARANKFEREESDSLRDLLHPLHFFPDFFSLAQDLPFRCRQVPSSPAVRSGLADFLDLELP